MKPGGTVTALTSGWSLGLAKRPGALPAIQVSHSRLANITTAVLK